jgi:hypothetical protein
MTVGEWLLIGLAVLVVVGGALWLDAWFRSPNGDGDA